MKLRSYVVIKDSFLLYGIIFKKKEKRKTEPFYRAQNLEGSIKNVNHFTCKNKGIRTAE